MKTTLNQIREKSPGDARWKRLLDGLGKTHTFYEPLRIITILDSNGLDDALWCLRAVNGCDREIRLYAVWCARQVQQLATDKRSLDALDVAERFANGLASSAEFATARAAAAAAAGIEPWAPVAAAAAIEHWAHVAAAAAIEPSAQVAAMKAAGEAERAAAEAKAAAEVKAAAEAEAAFDAANQAHSDVAYAPGSHMFEQYVKLNGRRVGAATLAKYAAWTSSRDAARAAAKSASSTWSAAEGVATATRLAARNVERAAQENRLRELCAEIDVAGKGVDVKT